MVSEEIIPAGFVFGRGMSALSFHRAGYIHTPPRHQSQGYREKASPIFHKKVRTRKENEKEKN